MKRRRKSGRFAASRYYLVEHIQDDVGYRQVRENLSKQYSLVLREPDIQIFNVDKDGDRTLYLKHYMYNDVPLAKPTEMLKHIHHLWGYDVVIESVDRQDKMIDMFEL